jgi:hypothetical protein
VSVKTKRDVVRKVFTKNATNATVSSAVPSSPVSFDYVFYGGMAVLILGALGYIGYKRLNHIIPSKNDKELGDSMVRLKQQMEQLKK